MFITPNSRVYLLDTPLDNSYKNELYFSTHDAQYDYFRGQVKHTLNNVTYQRKNQSIRVDLNIDDLWNINYIMYQNTQFGTKWFYAFITKMEYISETVTEISVETDVYQTWRFEATIGESFVVREHVSDDSIGANLNDEGLETGEYTTGGFTALNVPGDNWNLLGVSDCTPMGDDSMVGNIYNHVVTGLTYYPFPTNVIGINWLKNIIDQYTSAGKADAIVIIFTVPEMMITNIINDGSWTLGKPLEAVTAPSDISKNVTISKHLSTLNGYTPKNNKMLVYPYNFLYLTNSTGSNATFRYEDFSTSSMVFNAIGSIAPNLKLLLCPCNYKGITKSYEYGLNLEGFPLASWVTDAYNAWLAGNSAGAVVTMIGSAVAVGAGIATGNLLAIGGGALSIAHEISQLHQASIQPDQSKGQVGNGNTMYSNLALDYYYSHMTIKQEYAKRIDGFFSMFGYKVDQLKHPAIHTRENWNYLQTIDINITGGIPSDDMIKLKSVYDQGVTLWHNPDHIMDYSLSNDII